MRTRTRALLPAAPLMAAALTVALASSASAADVTAKRTITDGGKTYQLALTGPNSAAAGGANVTVSGTGYNTGQGVYVGLCAVDGAPGANKPTPCLGGQDQSGTTGASHWVSNTGGGTVPNSSRFGANGSFSVKIHVKADLGGGKVCGETVECAIVTRADHFDSGDRKYDVHIPVTFQ
ncbi:hypothetical protein [Streptomyces spectabilis]|uniref:Putative membrane protein n=1 Tax=Streptomyces spectabilis TaxID=68270 RepID=A0A5P2XJU9_STRST|nr:hypothetical protein [Streptomyces spectabilis]MBB5105150.1 putative membrane protein [Streptomyces spectabilis]MCI3905877.1 hypothetical protein [Streptomyces spectabilis]QEV62796.1 hypothetical protein CP982_32200 [Streptomyces spectabilis]GGV06149.1 hypothetical protein GCM10010245_12630 [Streptomyces spectabilis]